ncbi:helicase associated domain-containing protein [Streptomyces sp. NPDC094438]|uniref:helicase associated domain-containing protein n=1 Tax=Streptomyces sp. NPDC094438 TaxID=3366061 RepID=UPI00380567DC
MWLEGFQAQRRWRTENNITGLYAAPDTAETRTGATTTHPLGRWIHQQRRAQRAGLLKDHRKKQLDDEGMVWEPGEEDWQTKLRALATYRHAHGHLAPRQDATWTANSESPEYSSARSSPTSAAKAVSARTTTGRSAGETAHRHRPGLGLPLATRLATPPHPRPTCHRRSHRPASPDRPRRALRGR